MGKIKKIKETTKPVKSELTKVSNKKTLKPKKIQKPKLEKKIKTDTSKPKLEKGTNGKKNSKGFTAEIEQQFKKGVEALLQYEEQRKSKDLFTREKPIFLQIDSVRIPICPNRRIRFPLEHTLLTDKQEVCLIVPDLKRGRRVDHEPTIEHYEDVLRSKNITSIKRIIPMRQLRVEYDQFELKRRLCGYYDYFLAAGNVSGHANHILGKIFYEKRKNPIPINLEAPNLGETIENSLKKVSLHIHPLGSSFTVQFGHSEMTPEQLADNLKNIAVKLDSSFPGGWSNIRSLHVKTEKSISIPVYYTLKSPNKVNVPVIKPVRPKTYEKVTDELTTRETRDSKVTVHPGGKVDYSKIQKGKSKNQLRKIRQGKIQKKTAKIRARQVKIKAKKDKLKSQIKTETVKTVKQEKVKTVAKKQKKNKEQLQAPVQSTINKTKKQKAKTTDKQNLHKVSTNIMKEKKDKVKKNTKKQVKIKVGKVA